MLACKTLSVLGLSGRQVLGTSGSYRMSELSGHQDPQGFIYIRLLVY
jgi:hypothetical protein